MTRNLIDLTGKHVLIVGGSRGIGAAAARMVASAGGVVTIAYRSDRAAADALLREFSGGLALQVEVSEPGAVDSAVADAVAKQGPDICSYVGVLKPVERGQ